MLPVRGLPDFRPGDDLAGAIATAAPWLRDGDVLVVTSKAVSKVEGRLVPAPTEPAAREAARQAAIEGETVRVVAARGRTRIVETRHGLVLAAAGVDASNVRAGELALLPLDPDASARALRTALADRLGVTVAVVVSDTMGRPWRTGVVDVAIGAAGVRAVEDLRGATDTHGMRLEMTEVAVADELAAAAELAKGKLSAVPVAVVRGLAPVDDPRGARALLRSSTDDLFRLGTAEAVEQGRREALADTAEAVEQGRREALADTAEAVEQGRREALADAAEAVEQGRREALADAAEAVEQGRREALADTAAAPPPAHADAVSLLTGWRGTDAGQRSLGSALLAYLDARPDATRRACRPGHLTASALVLDAAGEHVLLTLHPRVGAWVVLGGHLEPEDPTVAAAAAREALEESGIAGLAIEPDPLYLGVHPVTCSLGVPTRHLDVTFLFTAPPGAQPVRSAESDDLAWWPVHALPENSVEDLEELVTRGLARRAAG